MPGTAPTGPRAQPLEESKLLTDMAAQAWVTEGVLQEETTTPLGGQPKRAVALL